jgi:hypothetical protein
MYNLVRMPNNQFVKVERSINDYKYRFELTKLFEPDECYLAINDKLQYIYAGVHDEEYVFWNIKQRKIRQQIKN